MKKYFVLLLVLFGLVGCTTFHPSIPENYIGPQAILTDTSLNSEISSADIFIAYELDGKLIDHSIRQTVLATDGMGNFLQEKILERPVPAKEITVSVFARRVHASGIASLLDDNEPKDIRRKITVNFIEGHEYAVEGELSPEESKIWIVDSGTGEKFGS